MPCNSDYMDPNQSERNSKEVAEHLMYIQSLQPYIILPKYISEAANNFYGNSDKLNEMVVLLCSIISRFDNEELNRIVYNGKDPKSRKLANWWDIHEKEDAKRINQDRRDKKDDEIIKRIKNEVLSEYEWKVLKKYFKRKQ